MSALSNADTWRGRKEPPHIGLSPNVSPEVENLSTGVSVRYAHDPAKEWFVLRVSYGRAKKACELIKKDSEEYYLPFHHVIRLVNRKKKRVQEPLLPNFIFVYAKGEYVKTLVDDVCRAPYFSYYYNHFEVNEFGKNPPLTIDYQCMMNFIRATSIDNEHVRIVDPRYVHYKSGDKVRIIDGEFCGVEGKVARVAGQQRVVVELYGLCLIATAYIPTAFLKPVNDD